MRIKDPPGIVFPFSGQTLLRAGTAYLMAINTLMDSQDTITSFFTGRSLPQGVDPHHLHVILFGDGSRVGRQFLNLSQLVVEISSGGLALGFGDDLRDTSIGEEEVKMALFLDCLVDERGNGGRRRSIGRYVGDLEAVSREAHLGDGSCTLVFGNSLISFSTKALS